jgi:hypothetical protein
MIGGSAILSQEHHLLIPLLRVFEKKQIYS